MTFHFIQSQSLKSKSRQPKSPVQRQGWPFPLEIVWSTRRRKTIAIDVLPEGIRLTAPDTLSVLQVEKVFKAHRDELYRRWQLVRLGSPSSITEPQKSQSMPVVSVHGEPLTVDMTPQPAAKRWSIRWVEPSRIEVRFPKELQEQRDEFTRASRLAVVSWLKTVAREDFSERIKDWAHKMDLHVNQLRLKDQRTRWGSCSTLGNINLNWRLIQAPSWIIDYVVVHELAHLREMNHSPRFWAIVKEYFPNYTAAKKWLRENGRSLHQL